MRGAPGVVKTEDMQVSPSAQTPLVQPTAGLLKRRAGSKADFGARTAEQIKQA